MKRLALVLLALLALPGTAAAAPYPDAVGTTAGLTGYWRLGEAGASTALPSAGTVLGSWVGSVTLGAPGGLRDDADTGLFLSGAGGVSLGSSWAAAGDLTLEAWINPSSSSGTRYVVSKGTTTTGFNLTYSGSTRRPAFSVGATGTTTITASQVLTLGTWHHLVATLQGSSLALYVDGQLGATGTASGPVRRSAALPLVAGRPSNSTSSGLVGTLDDVAIYDRALAGAEAAAHAAAGIDATVPDVAISGPAGRTDQTDASFALSAVKPRLTYSCSLDNAAFAACTAPTYRGLASGAHTLRVRSTDRWGLTSPIASYGWTIDPKAASDYTPTPPSTSIAARVDAVTSSSDASFSFSATKDRVTFACSLDGAAFTPCGATMSYSWLNPGDHTLRVRSTDRFGQAEDAPAAFSWKIDRSAPDTMALALAPAPGAEAGSAVFAATEAGRFECKVGGASDWSACAAPVALPAGVSAISVRAIDAAGNADASPATVKLGAAPDGTEPTGATGFASAAAGLVFTASRGATLSCRLDGGEWKDCASPLSVDGLGWGRHAFAVRAAFAGGTTLESPDTAWTAAAPAPRIAALQFPVLLKRGRDGRARANGRKPALRFALNVASGVHVSVARVRGGKPGKALGAWSVSAQPGDAVVPLPDKLVKRLKRGRYKLVARAAGARDVSRAFAVV